MLGEVCSFDYIEPVSFTQENTEVLQCWVWMWSPDQLPRSKLTTVFPEGVGRSRPGVPTGPLGGAKVNLLIHLDRYFDWSASPPTRTPCLRASGGPSSSSSDSDARPFPFYQEFVWFPGVLDGRLPASSTPRPRSSCRDALGLHQRDPGNEDHHDPRRQWADLAAGHRRQAEDAPRAGGGVADRYRSRSPARHRRRHGLAEEEPHTLETRGRSGARSLRSPARFREPTRRVDADWERRRSRSPSRFWPGGAHEMPGSYSEVMELDGRCSSVHGPHR